MSKTTSIIYGIVSVVVLLMIIIASSILAAEDQAYEDAEYTMMVCEGYWHNYKQIEVNCGNTATRIVGQ